MRLAFISDTHGHHRRASIPECDVLIHAGDLMTTGKRVEELSEFNMWLREQLADNVFLIAGNHDWLFESKRTLAEGILTEAKYLENSGLTINGLKFWGSPVQPAFMDWAFNVPRGEAIKKYWDMIPDDVDVLITHGPPFGVLDQINKHEEHLGCEELRKAVELKKPKLHIFGHIHGGHGISVTEHTTFINAAFVDENYRPRYPVITATIDNESVTVEGQ